MTEIPDGFVPNPRKGPLTDPWEPIFSRTQTGTITIGLRAGERHCNSRGFVHGGLIAALADNAMGLSYGATLLAEGRPSRSIVTLSLSVDYTAMARGGAWIEIAPRVIKAGRKVGFIDALVTADGKVVARASATFSAQEPASEA